MIPETYRPSNGKFLTYIKLFSPVTTIISFKIFHVELSSDHSTYLLAKVKDSSVGYVTIMIINFMSETPLSNTSPGANSVLVCVNSDIGIEIEREMDKHPQGSQWFTKFKKVEAGEVDDRGYFKIVEVK